MAKHNKKRNVGLIYEQLVRHISERVVNQDQESVDIAVKILEKHFKPGTELYKEFRLFNSLVHTRVDTRELASRIISESRTACKRHDSNRLTKEKSLLIKDINHGIDDPGFYSRKISEYRTYSTVQALLNEWRGAGKLFPEEIVKYETSLEDSLLRERREPSRNKFVKDPLVLKVMLEKFNKKYDKKLNSRQRAIVGYKIQENNSALIEEVKKTKAEAMSAVQKFYEGCDNEVLLEKKEDVLNNINRLNIDGSDRIIERALSLAALIEELESNDE